LCIYDAELFAGETIARMAEQYRRILAAVVEDAGQKLWQLPLLSAEEREQVLRGWNATGREYEQAGGRTLVELLQQAAEKYGDQTAVISEGRELSYGELEGRSNQLARYLRKRGIGAEEKVGICMRRSEEMVVGMVGVLKAGGAYVPLDPEYPGERLAYMAEDAEL